MESFSAPAYPKNRSRMFRRIFRPEKSCVFRNLDGIDVSAAVIYLDLARYTEIGRKLPAPTRTHKCRGFCILEE